MKKELQILHLEDDPTDAELIGHELVKAGLACRITLVDTERTFLDALERQRFDLILVDYSLPSFDGLTALSLARERVPDVPFLFVSGIIGEDRAIEALRSGATDYVLKDRLPRLASAVRRALREAEERAERKRAEDALRESEARHRVVADLTHDWEYWVGPDGRFLYVSPSCERITGYRCDAFLADSGLLRRLVHPDDKGGFDAHAREAHLTTQPSGWEFRIHRADGGERWIGHVCTPVFDEGGSFLGMRGSNRDITDRRRAEAERERLTTAIEQAGEIVVITDPRGVIQYVNPAFETVTGYAPAEAIGQNPRILKSGRQDDALYRDLWKTISEGRTWQGRMVNRRKDGTLYTEEATISPVRDVSGRIVNYVAVKRDMTEQLGLTAQLLQAQKMEAVGRLAGGVAHDFNNLLTVINGLAELAALELSPNDPLLPKLQGIRDAGDRAANLTRQLLAFARQQVVSPRSLDLNEAVGALERMLRRLIGEDIELVWAPGGPDVGRVYVDPSQLDQVLANLLVNARDAISGTGKVLIETGATVLDDAYCAAHPGTTSGEYAVLTVSDTGVGMDRGTVARIFEPFFTTKEPGKGTGLGLATVYGIVKQAGGSVHACSEPGQGTTFRIYLPRWRGAESAAVVRDEPKKPLRGTETVLLVEDEEPILELGRTILARQGYRVLTARTPGEALLLAGKESGEIHLLATDVVMPGMNGRELCERLWGVRPDLRCLYLSGYTADVITQRGVLPEGVHFLQKPYSLKGLAEKVRAVLDAERVRASTTP